MTTHIIHHANCPDGVVAYLIAAEAVGEHVRQPMNYGHDLPAELWGGGGHDNAAGFSLESGQGWEHR